MFWTGLILICFTLGALETAFAGGKPNVTRHEAKFMENSVNMHIEWQSPNPVTSVKISMPGTAKEITVDPYDNRRNPDGYSGEVDVNLDLGGTSSQYFNYVVQLQDELRLKSEPVTGQVKLPSVAQPGVILPAVVTPGVVTVPTTTTPTWPSTPTGQQTGQAAPWTGSSTSQQPDAVSSGMPSQTAVSGSQQGTAQPASSSGSSDGGLGR
jgi:hypothetical protein